MVIAINTIPFRKHSSDTLDFIYAVLQKIAADQAEHTFVFIVDKPLGFSDPLPKNIIPVIISPKPVSAFLCQYWHSYKLSSILKKYNADILISADAISLRTKVDQCLIIPDLDFIYSPQILDKNEKRFLKRNTLKYLNKAKGIFIFSQFLKDELVKIYKQQIDKIEVLNIYAEGVFNPVEFAKRETVKEQYAQGNEYFLFSGRDYPANNLYNLLKAFSFFKKRQKSNMQLLIAVNGDLSEEISEKLRLFRFKDEVKILKNISIDEFAPVMASAYAFVYPTLSNSPSMSLLQAFKSEVPIITSDLPVLHELASDASLYCDPNDVRNIAEKMMMVFKNENLRKQLIAKGVQQIENAEQNNATALLWNTIKKAVN